MHFRAALVAPVVLCLAVPAGGQGLPRGPAIQLMPIRLEGTVTGVGPGMVALTTAAGEIWTLKIPAKVEVRVTGTAQPNVLRPGMYLRFVAPVDKRRSLVEGKVEKLIIFSPSQETGRMPGVFYAGQEGDEAALQPNPAIPPAAPGGRAPDPPPNPPQAGDPGAPAKAAPAGRRGKAKGQAAANVETFDIRGRLTNVKGRWLTIYARNTFFKPTLRIELAEKPEIKLDVDTYSLAKSGDKIAVLGVQVAAQTLQAMKVAIELSEPLGEPGKKPPRPTGKPPVRRPAKGSNGRQPFEVAQEAEQDQPDQPKQAPPKPKPEKPGPQDERSNQIVQFLQAKPAEVQGKPGLKLDVTDGEPIPFAPCKQVPGKEVLGRFGLPDQVQKINSTLPSGKDGKPVEIQWQLWVYGPVMFFVDETDATRYLAVRTNQKKQQPAKPGQEEEKNRQNPEKPPQQP